MKKIVEWKLTAEDRGKVMTFPPYLTCMKFLPIFYFKQANVKIENFSFLMRVNDHQQTFFVYGLKAVYTIKELWWNRNPFYFFLKTLRDFDGNWSIKTSFRNQYLIQPLCLSLNLPPKGKGETIHRMYRNRDYFGDGSIHDTWRLLTIQMIWCSFFEKK